MKDMKPFLTVDQQIELLETRNMSFLDRDGARRFLLVHNYYSVVNGYKNAFLDEDRTNQDNDWYRSGTDFKHLEALYLFDRALRRVTLGRLLDIEDSMRTAVIYSFCEKHRGQFDYLDPSCYSSTGYRSKKDYSQNLINVLSALQRVISRRHRKEYVDHYLKKYGHVPLWVISKCLTFGVMSNFYELQQLDVKQKACSYLSKTTGKDISPKEMMRTYKVLSNFRNICAHEERLYCATIGRNKENSFRELVMLIAGVLSEDRMGKFAQEVLNLLSILSTDPIPESVSEDAMKSMRIDKGFLAGYCPRS